jgi:hypothetical protein
MQASSQTTAAVAELRRLVRRGVAPDVRGLLPAHAALVEQLIGSFGNLGAARQEAGVTRPRVHVDREFVAAELRRLASVGVAVLARRLREFGEEGLLQGIYRTFGSLPAARRAAGIRESPVPKSGGTG